MTNISLAIRTFPVRRMSRCRQGVRPMQIPVHTPSVLGALLRGMALGGLMLAFLWVLGLPLEWRIALILFLAVGVSSAINFYDGSLRDVPRLVSEADFLMRGIQWDFSIDAPRDPARFVEQVGSQQTDPGAWKPEQTIADRGPLEILVLQYEFESEDDCEQILILDPPPDGVWTQGRILHAIQHHLRDHGVLGHHTFFEGLIRHERNRFELVLGS